MAETEDTKEKKTLTLSSGKLGIKKPVGVPQIRQSFSHGRSKAVDVIVKRKRTVEENALAYQKGGLVSSAKGVSQDLSKPRGLTEAEWDVRLKAVQNALKTASETEEQLQKTKEERAALEKLRLDGLELYRKEEKEARKTTVGESISSTKKEPLEDEKKSPDVQPAQAVDKLGGEALEEGNALSKTSPMKTAGSVERPQSVESGDGGRPKKAFGASSEEGDEDGASSRSKKGSPKIVARKVTGETTQSRGGRHQTTHQLHGFSVRDLLTNSDEENPVRTYGSRRHRGKPKKSSHFFESKQVTREVIIPEVIMIQELASRMAIRGAEVIKKLIEMGMMVTINQNIDGDTAELLVREFGHTPKRVAESDVEEGLEGVEDLESDLLPRPPVVTVMGHVDHGKTSLLDAIRKTDIVTAEAGGITQHIGAYQVTMPSGAKITFIDTPGHAAFTEMRARGANVTDLVILLVAADDGIMEQTIEAIHHARAAGVPMIVAINKIDKPAADASRIRQMLLQQEVVVEELGGDVMCVEVSAKTGAHINHLEEAILAQAEILGLKANARRSAQGVVVEAQLERGRGAVATVLVQKGTLRTGDIFVSGAQWGRVRALVDDKGKALQEALPSQPVEVIGFTGTPVPGDDFIVVGSESKARSIYEFRMHRQKNMQSLSLASGRASFEQLLTQTYGDKKELAVVVKSDVQGSLEAIINSLSKIATEEVAVKILHAGVGAINESDVTLAKASRGIIIGFNVRANPSARDMTRQGGIDLRYYSIIYNLIDDIKAILSGLLSPTLHERFLGNAAIRQVFQITKVGKIAGCYVTEGTVKRGAKVRLLRENVVIHEGSLKTLKRLKEEVREVKSGYECGMAFENYQDIREGDVIECFDVEEVARILE